MAAWIERIIAMILELLKPKPKPTPEPQPEPDPETPKTTFTSQPGVRVIKSISPGESVKWQFTPDILSDMDPEAKRSLAACRSSSQYLEIRSYKIKLSPAGPEPRYPYAWQQGRRYSFELRLTQREMEFYIDGAKMAAVPVNAGAWEVCLGWPWSNWPKPGVSGFVTLEG